MGVFESKFGTGYVLAGTHPSLKQPKIKYSNVAFSMRTAALGVGHRVNLLRTNKSIGQAFPFMDEIGLDPPARCGGCRKCQECTVRAQKYSAVERRLEKAGEMESYNKQFEDFIARGAISEMSEEEMKTYQGPVNYVGHQPVHNPDRSEDGTRNLLVLRPNV